MRLARAPLTGCVTLCIHLPDRVTAEIAAKSLRKAQAVIRDAGADNLVLVLQGRLAAGDTIAEAGLSAQPKVAKLPTPHDEHVTPVDGARFRRRATSECEALAVATPKRGPIVCGKGQKRLRR